MRRKLLLIVAMTAIPALVVSNATASGFVTITDDPQNDLPSYLSIEPRTSCDTIDPVIPHSNSLNRFETPSPSTDITSGSVVSTTIGGFPALQATFNVAGPLPAPGSTNPTAFKGKGALAIPHRSPQPALLPTHQAADFGSSARC